VIDVKKLATSLVILTLSVFALGYCLGVVYGQHHPNGFSLTEEKKPDAP
jgi:hypothetical protein